MLEFKKKKKLCIERTITPVFYRFLAIPFVLELRTLMDWIWTDTTMAIGSWLTMEDIYANIYVLKCWREAEKVHKIFYRNDPKFSDRYAWANSADPDQTAPRGAV